VKNKQLPLFPAAPQQPQDITRKTPIGATLALFARHLTQEGKSEHTVKAFMADMELLLERTGGSTPVSDYTTGALNDFLAWMEFERGIPCSRKTYARRVTTLKVFFRWLYTLSAVPHDPAKAVLQRSGPAPLSAALNPAQVQAALLAARRMKRDEDHDYRPELILQLLLQTGIKKSETERLLLTDIDRTNPQSPTLFVRQKAKDIYKERRIALEAALPALIDAYSAQYQPATTLFTCTTRNLEYILTEVGEQAAIPFKLSFEVLRWTSAVRDWRAGMEEEAIREKLGLSKISWYETGQKIRRLVDAQIHAETLSPE
jgi:integrase/recombinase XerD